MTTTAAPAASTAARIMGALLRTTKYVSRRYQGGPHMQKVIDIARAAPLPVPTAKMRARLDVREERLDGRRIWTLAPRDRAPTAHLLFFHGGGYVFSAVQPHWSFYARLAERHGIKVSAPMYPLAPEHQAPEATAWALAAYRHIAGESDAPFVLGGDSAGGGLAAATIMAARDGGDRLSSGLLLICPWLEISGSHPDQPIIEPRDSILRLRGVQDAGKLYRGDLSPDDVRVSPLHGNWSGLPPMLMFGGTDDILVPDARALKAKLPSATYVEGAGLMHDWPLFFFRESRTAQEQMARFILDHAPA
jgi:epsilon-lactone hydrolase